MLVLAYGMHKSSKTKDIEKGTIINGVVMPDALINQNMQQSFKDTIQSTSSLGGTSISMQMPVTPHDNPLTPLPLKTKISLTITASTIVVTIALWCFTTTGHLTPYLGNIGIASLPSLVILFSTGQLHLQDWLRLPWDVVMLAMGGSALTLIAHQSGLMPALASLLASKLSVFSLWMQHLLACTAMATLASISSRFIAALVYLPILVSTAKVLVATNPKFMEMPFILLCTFACSAGMALPISGLINYSFAQQRVTYPSITKTRELDETKSPTPSNHETTKGDNWKRKGNEGILFGMERLVSCGYPFHHHCIGMVVSVGYLMVYHTMLI